MAVMRRPFMKEYISIVVADVHDSPDLLHNPNEAIEAMNTQLMSAGMEDLVLDNDALCDNVCVPGDLERLSSPSLISSLSSLRTARSSIRSSTQGSSRSSTRISLLAHPTALDHQNHQLELEEERRIASEIALARLQQKAQVVL